MYVPDCMAAEVYDESFLTLRCDGTTDNAAPPKKS